MGCLELLVLFIVGYLLGQVLGYALIGWFKGRE